MFCRIPCAKDWSELQANIRGRGGSQWIIRTGHVGGALTRPAMRSIARGAPRQKADSSPLKRIRNDKYMKAGSRRGAPRNDKYVSERGGETLGVSLRFPFGKNREAVSAPLAAGMHRCFVGSPSRGEGLRFLRMTTERGRVLGRWGHLRR